MNIKVINLVQHFLYVKYLNNMILIRTQRTYKLKHQQIIWFDFFQN